jgi:hypothetical protein
MWIRKLMSLFCENIPLTWKAKVKFTPYNATKAKKGGREGGLEV